MMQKYWSSFAGSSPEKVLEIALYDLRREKGVGRILDVHMKWKEHFEEAETDRYDIEIEYEVVA